MTPIAILAGGALDEVSGAHPELWGFKTEGVACAEREILRVDKFDKWQLETQIFVHMYSSFLQNKEKRGDLQDLTTHI